MLIVASYYKLDNRSLHIDQNLLYHNAYRFNPAKLLSIPYVFMRTQSAPYLHQIAYTMNQCLTGACQWASEGKGKNVKSAYEPKWTIRLELIPVSVALSDQEYVYSHLDRMLVSHTHLFAWLERGTMRVKCLSQEGNNVPGQGSDRLIRSQVY